MDTTMDIKKKMVEYYQQNKQEFLYDHGLDGEDEYAYDEWIEDYIMTSELLTTDNYEDYTRNAHRSY